ncbi:uncharacterized protein E0L32_008423 [Thyridium curvatum]|uniref:EGF-like domain-containing protein n=1 Tax=Thyridium curvatum TaxID=1093900 RepID=A0A507B088_9PEZI|nr:uncharacterized protein E0L32_008423 [Thyridium curvatum]TPX10689.1 hypothetical protein E0L32_008423 [Thyridium curvatum]
MSYPQDGRDMDRPTTAGGSIRRARERAEAGLPRENFDQFTQRMAPDGAAQKVAPRIPRSQATPALQTKDGQIGVAISRPTPVAQWPLAGPVAIPTNAEPYRPPPGRSEPPQRPPRPSRVPSMLDASRIQEHTPVFQYTPHNERESELSVPQTTSSVSRPSTISSVGSIPDFPVPVAMPVQPPRRSVNLGPPPSSRRGASSFYSNASYVSPIPEESPRSRSHASYASSAAMPENWGTPSPGPSPNYPETYFEEAITEEVGRENSPYDDGDESQLVRSASIGKRAKAALVTNVPPPPHLDTNDPSQRPGPSPVQRGPFRDGTGYVDASSSSSTLPTTRNPAGAAALTADSMLNAYDAASSTDPSNPSRRASVSPQPPPGARPYSRLSAIRRPPRLDIDAVRKAEARGSLTSLPDLIKRATRLAASLEKGRRPASRIDDLEYSPGFGELGGNKEFSVDNEKHQSGLSDMLAAFPPPAQVNRRSIRQSLRDQVGSWPLPLGFNSRDQSSTRDEYQQDEATQTSEKRRRKCCGMPLWVFILLLILILVIVAAAVVLPLEFLVIRKQNNNTPQASLGQCQSQLRCQNGGTNFVSDQGLCSCICANGFTGFDCSTAGAAGCTTTSIAQGSGGASSSPGGAANSGGNIDNVTLGDAIPRLIQQAQSNFSVPLNGGQILAKLNSGNLSCAAENALVTFDGRTNRVGAAKAEVTDLSGDFRVVNNAGGGGGGDDDAGGGGVATVTETVTNAGGAPAPSTLAALDARADAAGYSGVVPSIIFATTRSFSTSIDIPPRTTTTVTTTVNTGIANGGGAASSTRSTSTTSSSSSSSSTTSAAPAPSTTFVVTEEVLDFARVAILYVLQEGALAEAEAAQNILQRLFSAAARANRGTGTGTTGGGVSVEQARNVTLNNGNSVNLLTFVVDTGNGAPVGGRGAAAAVKQKRSSQGFLFRGMGLFGGR